MTGDGTHRRRPCSPFIPLLLTATALLLWVATQTWGLYGARAELRTAELQQQNALQQSRQVRAQLHSIVEGTARLAGNGNANAQRVLDQLHQQGISVAADGE